MHGLIYNAMCFWKGNRILKMVHLFYEKIIILFTYLFIFKKSTKTVSMKF